MPAWTSARTWAGYAAAYWPSLNIVARSPFCFRALSSAGVLPLDGPSSKVSPTYPLQAAACAGVVTTVLATTIAAAASPVTSARFDRGVRIAGGSLGVVGGLPRRGRPPRAVGFGGERAGQPTV